MKKYVSLLLASILCITTLSGCASQDETTQIETSYAETIEWDAGYDVVVIGYGGAGATASIAAAEQGANVLLLEKAPLGKEGGNTKVSGQIVMAPTDRDKAIEYFTAMRGGFDIQSDKIIETIVDGSMATRDWLLNHGAKEIIEYPVVEYPELPGSDGISAVIIDEKEIQTGRVYRLMQDNVIKNKDKIDVWYESPGVELIQDPETKTILGVKVNHKGEMVNVYAKNGVVLATGGFENNQEMIENYVQLPEAYSKGAHYNTGDGIEMALKAGAKLWHMGNLAGPDANFIDPETGISAGYSIQGPGKHGQGALGSKSAIFVGQNGQRYTNEAFMTNHGHVNVAGTWKMLQIPTPAFAILDENALKSGPIYAGWSQDNSDELAKGWITKADTLEELAEKMGIDKEGLVNQVNLYNQFVQEQFDPQFNRDAEYLNAISETGPYYAFEMKATFTNTQGGPQRNENTEVIGMNDEVIPHLYSAGELGSYYVDIYNGGGNVSECIFSGDIAGKNAAIVKDDTPVLNIENTIADDLDVLQGEVELGENEYLGESQKGMGGLIQVKVKLDGDKIITVEIVSHHESEGISDEAIATIPQAIVDKQSTEVDTISGATVTSKAIIEAVEDALSKK